MPPRTGPTYDDAALPQGCTAGSQARGDAWSSDYAWIVNFNNGNVNNNNRNNNHVRLVR